MDGCSLKVQHTGESGGNNLLLHNPSYGLSL